MTRMMNTTSGVYIKGQIEDILQGGVQLATTLELGAPHKKKMTKEGDTNIRKNKDTRSRERV